MIFCFNRRGQIDKIITFLPLFILIFLLVAGFIVFSALISKSGKGFGDASSIQDNSLFFSSIGMTYGEKVMQVRVIDALFRASNPDKIYYYNLFFNDLRQWAVKNKACAFLISPNPQDGNIAGWKYNPQFTYQGFNAEVISSADVKYLTASKTGLFTLIKDKNSEIGINYYLGRCLE